MGINKVSSFNYNNYYKNTNKKEQSFKGTGKNNVTESIKPVTPYPADMLFLMAEQDVKNPNLIIDEFYNNEYNNSPKGRFGVSLARFSPKEKYEIAQYAEEIKLHKKGFYNIINAQNDDKTYRFNEQESLDLFFDAGENIEKHFSEFKKILNEKDKDNKPRFTPEECGLLMQYADLFDAYPKTFNSVLSIKELTPEEIKNLMLKMGEKIEENPLLLKMALSQTPYDENQDNYGETLTNTVQLLWKKEKEKFLKNQIKEQEYTDTQKREKEAKIESIKKLQLERIAKLKKAERELLREQKNKLKQERMEYLNKQVGWIPTEKIFNKVNRAVETGSHLILENGEVLPDETRDKIAYHISKTPRKAETIINARYQNLKPIFNEKDCCEIISELDTYHYPECIKTLKTIDTNKNEIFTPKQCKEILQQKQGFRDILINKLLYEERKLSSDDIVAMLKDSYTVMGYKSPFFQYLYEKDENGNYKYNVEECIEKCKDALYAKNNFFNADSM